MAAGHPESFIDIVNTASPESFEASLNALNEYTRQIRQSVANDLVRGTPPKDAKNGFADMHLRQAMGLK